MYQSEFTKEFLKILKKLKSKDKSLFKRLELKVEEILENPDHYKPLRNELKGLRRAHIGSFVITFQIRESTVIFISFKHHDYAYEEK